MSTHVEFLSNAQAFATHVRSMNERELMDLYDKIHAHSGLFYGLEEVFSEKESLLSEPAEGPTEQYTFNGSVYHLPRELVEGINSGDSDTVGSLLWHAGETKSSIWLTILLIHGVELNHVIQLLRTESCIRFLVQGDVMGSTNVVPNIANAARDLLFSPVSEGLEKLTNTPDGFAPSDGFHPRLTKCHLNTNGYPDADRARAIDDPKRPAGNKSMFFDHRFLSRANLRLGDYIDFTKGQGQYVSAPISETILESSWTTGISKPDIAFCEKTFRAYTAAERMKVLSRTYHLEPRARGAFDLLSFRKENVIFLLFKGRILTLGSISGLPRVPDYVESRKHNTRVGIGVQRMGSTQSLNSFSSLSDEEI